MHETLKLSGISSNLIKRDGVQTWNSVSLINLSVDLLSRVKWEVAVFKCY